MNEYGFFLNFICKMNPICALIKLFLHRVNIYLLFFEVFIKVTNEFYDAFFHINWTSYTRFLIIDSILLLGNTMLISHHITTPQDVLDDIKSRLHKTENLTFPLTEMLSLVEQLNTFDMGRFVITNKGFNGYWTAYIILYGQEEQNLSALEHWMINNAPIILATRERFDIFQQETLKRIKPNMHIASLPCGLMEDLLSLPFDLINNVELTGIDLDEDSLELAQKIALDRGLHCEFLKRDAWDLKLSNVFDLVVSNGLNIYEPNSERLIALYQEIAKSLKPDGVFITSYVAHPDDKAKPSAQKGIDLHDAAKQKAIFQDIVQGKWQCYQREEDMRMQLKASGFAIESIIYDAQSLFPTVIAKKI